MAIFVFTIRIRIKNKKSYTKYPTDNPSTGANESAHEPAFDHVCVSVINVVIDSIVEITA